MIRIPLIILAILIPLPNRLISLAIFIDQGYYIVSKGVTYPNIGEILPGVQGDVATAATGKTREKIQEL